MGTLIKMKAEVVNPELPVLTEQGILPYYTGVYVNRLADKGVTLTQTEINAVTAFIDSLIATDVFDKIGTFYPFMGNVNVPLIGNKELEFTDVTSANTSLDFVNNKLRGVKYWQDMLNVKFLELANTDFGVLFAGSCLSKIPSTGDYSKVYKIIDFSGDYVYNSLPDVQLRINPTNNEFKFEILNFYDTIDTELYIRSPFAPVLEASENLHNYSFTYGLINTEPTHEKGALEYNRTLKRDGVLLANTASNDGVVYIHSDVSNLHIRSTSHHNDAVVTTLGFFNEIPSAAVSKAFVDALDTFTAAVGKTVSVG